MFALSVMLKVDPSHREEFMRTALAQSKNSLANEAGCLGFEVYVNSEDPDLFHYHEVYTDKAAFEDVHIHTDYFATYTKTVAKWVVSKEVKFWNSLE